MARLTKEQVLEAPLMTEEFDVPEWGGSILLGEWAAGRTNETIAMFRDADADSATNDPSLMVKLFIMGCVDPKFDESDIPSLLEKSGAVVMRASQRIMALNGLTEAARDAARGKS